jgi:predicted dehydrogenase
MKSPRKKTLVVGVGSIGERHVRCFQATDRVEVAICEPNAELRQTIADRYGIVEAYPSLDSALTAEFDQAVIATPAPFHVPQAIQFVNQGTHVLIEKPLSVDPTGIFELEQLVQTRGLIAAVAYPYRAHPALAEMYRCITSGELGKPLQVTLTTGQHFPTYRPAYRDTYYRTRATGGGAIQDALSHMINAVEWIVGPTQAVAGDAARLQLDGVEVEDTVHVLARNGEVMTVYSLNQHQPANELSLAIICERGQARFEGHRARWAKLAKVDGTWSEHFCDGLERDTVFRNQANAFLDATEGKCPPLCNLREGHDTLKSVMAILQSLSSHRWETVATHTTEPAF